MTFQVKRLYGLDRCSQSLHAVVSGLLAWTAVVEAVSYPSNLAERLPMADRLAPMRSDFRRTSLLALFAVACLLPAWPCGGSELRQTPIVKAVQQARPSVVNIRGEKTLTTPGPDVPATEAGRRVNGMGTGVILDSRGYVVTNFHVVDGVREIQVTLDGGQHYTARLLARDTETDLAVIKIDAPDPLSVITLGTSADLMPGEPVIAVGNAFGYEQIGRAHV